MPIGRGGFCVMAKICLNRRDVKTSVTRLQLGQ
jgi:hypothetical protein